MRKALQQYQAVDLESDVASASPYRITQMLLQGCLRFMKQARFAIEKNDYVKKSEFISKAEAIVTTLASSLEREVAPELTDNMARLYDYALRRMVDASVEMSVEKLDDAIKVIADIKSGWDAIPQDEINRAEARRSASQ